MIVKDDYDFKRMENKKSVGDEIQIMANIFFWLMVVGMGLFLFFLSGLSFGTSLTYMIITIIVGYAQKIVVTGFGVIVESHEEQLKMIRNADRDREEN